MFEVETRKYILTGIMPMLGTQPAKEDVRTAYIQSKAPTQQARDEEAEMDFGGEDDKSLTVFCRDEQNRDRLMILDYMVRGFFKSSLLALGAINNIPAAKSKVDRFVFVSPRRIPLMRDGEPIYEEDRIYERPLRAETMRGPRVSLVGSECVDDPWYVTIEVTLIPNKGSARGEKVTWEALEDALDYGRLSGISQYRNGGFGRFTWKRV